MSQSHRIGTRVRASRERAGLSREALAFHSGISWSAIAQVESGRRINLRPKTLAALARALGVSIDYLVLGRPVTDSICAHHALLYDADDKLAATAASFLSPVLDRDEPVLVVMSESPAVLLRERLGARAAEVQFAERTSWYRTPTAALDAYRAFVTAAVENGATWTWILGEPVWTGCSDSEVRLWARYESLINLVFSGMPASVICLYDTRAVEPAVIEHARATHRHSLEGESLAPNTHYTDPGNFMLQPEGSP